MKNFHFFRKGAAGSPAKTASVLNLFLTLSFAWIIFNQVYVFLFLDGAKSYRVESAFFIFAFFALIQFFAAKKSEPSDPEPGVQPAELILLAAAALICWLVVSLPLLRLPFLSDDYVFLLNAGKNFQIFQTEGFFRPFFNAVFYLTAKIFGPSDSAFHALNLLLHLSNSLLIYAVSTKLFSSRRYACFAAILFLLNPIQPEAVAWISGLQELLWVFFILLASFFYIRKKEIEIRAIALAVFFVILALLSKETAIVYVILFPVLDAVLFGFKRGKKYHLALGTFFALFVIYMVVRIRILSIPSDFFSTPSLYFIKSFFSEPFTVFPFPWNQALFGNLPALKFILSLLAAAFLWHHFFRGGTDKKTVFGCGLIFIGIFPLYKMLDIASDLQGARYLYFSTFGWAIMLASVFLPVAKRKTNTFVLFLLMILLSSFALHKNLIPWKRAGHIMEALPSETTEDTAPDNYFGAYILRNGYKEYKILQQKLK